MHSITDSILDVRNAFQNTNVPIHDRVCVSTPPYYIDWFERSCSSVTHNRYYGPFLILFMNAIQGGKPSRRQWNIILDTLVTILKYMKGTIDHDI